jgi:hypothetical protein
MAITYDRLTVDNGYVNPDMYSENLPAGSWITPHSPGSGEPLSLLGLCQITSPTLSPTCPLTGHARVTLSLAPFKLFRLFVRS